MCHLKEVQYYCGHSKVTVLSRCSIADEDHEPNNGGSDSSSDSSSVVHAPAAYTFSYFSEPDCGKGGELLTCMQHQSLTTAQLRLLKVTESKVKRVESTYYSLRERIEAVREQFHPSFFEPGVLTTGMFRNLPELMDRASAARDTAWEKLRVKINVSKELLLEEHNRYPRRRSMGRRVMYCNKPISSWHTDDVWKLRRAVKKLEKEAQGLEAEEVQEELRAAAEGTVPAEGVEDPDASSSGTVEVHEAEEHRSEDEPEIQIRGLGDGFDIDIWGDDI